MKFLSAIVAIVIFSCSAPAQESLVDRVSKLEARINNLSDKMDKLLALQQPATPIPAPIPAPPSPTAGSCGTAGDTSGCGAQGSNGMGSGRFRIVQRIRSRRGC